MSAERFASLHAAAWSTRSEFSSARQRVAAAPVASHGAVRFELLRLLAAADSADSRPTEVVTRRGFRVTLAFDAGDRFDAASICVLVQGPAHMLAEITGTTVSLWNGTARFELGQFDVDGKALGVLPPGVDITIDDCAHGKVRLEESLTRR